MLDTIYVVLHYVLFVLMLAGIVVLVVGLINTIQRLLRGDDVGEACLNIHVHEEQE